MDLIDYYSMLEVHNTATSIEIKEAYKRKSKLYHPDINKSPDANHKMQILNEAYEILKSPIKRAKYDLDWSNRKKVVKQQTKYTKTNTRSKTYSKTYSSWEKANPFVDNVYRLIYWLGVILALTPTILYIRYVMYTGKFVFIQMFGFMGMSFLGFILVIPILESLVDLIIILLTIFKMFFKDFTYYFKGK